MPSAIPVRKFAIEFGRTADHSIDYLLGIIDDARVTTLQQIAGLSAEQLDWQFKPGWNSIGALLSHIAAIEHYFRIEFVEKRPLTAAENEHWAAALDMGERLPELLKGEPASYYIELLNESRRQMLVSLANVTFDDMAERRSEYDPENGCNLAWALYHMAEDEVHHRGQITIIKKLYQDAISG